MPPSSFGPALLNLSYSEMGSDWEYSLTLEAVEPAFDEFKRLGRLTFKVGGTVLREEFKVGLENVAKFQAIAADLSEFEQLEISELGARSTL